MLKNKLTSILADRLNGYLEHYGKIFIRNNHFMITMSNDMDGNQVISSHCLGLEYRWVSEVVADQHMFDIAREIYILSKKRYVKQPERRVSSDIQIIDSSNSSNSLIDFMLNSRDKYELCADLSEGYVDEIIDQSEIFLEVIDINELYNDNAFTIDDSIKERLLQDVPTSGSYNIEMVFEHVGYTETLLSCSMVDIDVAIIEDAIDRYGKEYDLEYIKLIITPAETTFNLGLKQ